MISNLRLDFYLFLLGAWEDYQSGITLFNSDLSLVVTDLSHSLLFLPLTHHLNYIVDLHISKTYFECIIYSYD